MEFGLEIDNGGRGGGQESQFHSLVFMQAVIIAYNIFSAERHSNESEKRKTFESSITFVGQHVFVHEAIYQTEINISFNNQHVLINKLHNINTGVQSSNT